jgi:S-adenosylmethionine synthetase
MARILSTYARRMNSKQIIVESLIRTPTGRQVFELVERKGKGHPDSICDAVAEEVSQALCREYAAAFGRILHFNVDKAMLVAGRSQPKLGGGKIVEPMRLDTTKYVGRSVPRRGWNVPHGSRNIC